MKKLFLTIRVSKEDYWKGFNLVERHCLYKHIHSRKEDNEIGFKIKKRDVKRFRYDLEVLRSVGIQIEEVEA